ncbi:MAG: hypothetical protein JSU63_07775 [Phycisphaerales bacterium]|nr:MAG: hypothetical protein JSU63_07775 [Phycisphaerales bacterium]
MLRRQTAWSISAVILLMAVVAPAAELSVSSIDMSPGTIASIIASGSISGDSTYAVTIMLELKPQAGNVGQVEFTPEPPMDIIQLEHPWPTDGTFEAFDTLRTFSIARNGSIHDNRTLVPAPTTFAGDLSEFPVRASADASGKWDVMLTTGVGDSYWEGVTTTLIQGTITITSNGCVTDLDCDDGDFCNGAETCDAQSVCQSGSSSCTDPAFPFCSEDTDECVQCLAIGDIDGDGVISVGDHAGIPGCMTGPVGPVEPPAYPDNCRCLDANDDGDVDLSDYAVFQLRFTES